MHQLQPSVRETNLQLQKKEPKTLKLLDRKQKRTPSASASGAWVFAFDEAALDAERLTLADRLAFGRKPSHPRADPPELALAIEPHQVVGGAIARVTRGRGGRGGPEDGNRAADRACSAGGKGADSLPVGMAVQDRLGAEVAHDSLERWRIQKTAQLRRRSDERRVVDEHDSRQAFSAGPPPA